jgi:hypothetical protein
MIWEKKTQIMDPSSGKSHTEREEAEREEGRGKEEGSVVRKMGLSRRRRRRRRVMEEPDDIHRDSAWHLLGVHVRRDYPSDKWFDVVSLCLWRRLPSRSVRILRSAE